jgi:hypothetical protein
VNRFWNLQDHATTPDYGRDSDIWPLGLLFFYIASRGCCPIITQNEITLAERNRETRLGYLSRTRGELIALLNASNTRRVADDWRLSTAHPLLFDLIERMVRPSSERISLADCSVHPFFWDAAVVERLVLAVGEQPGEPASNVSSRMFCEDAIHALQALYPNVLLKLFETTIQVTIGADGKRVKTYGVWEHPFTEQLKFTFRG